MVTAIDIPTRTWAGGLRHNKKIGLAAGDIRLALNDYRAITGKDAAVIILNSMNSQFAGEAPDGIEVRYCAGVLGWEVYLAGEEKPKDAFFNGAAVGRQSAVVNNTPLPIPEYPQPIMTPLNCGVVRRSGRKTRELPDDLIRNLAGKGMGCKAIATQLRKRGIEVGFRTIARRLQGVLIDD